MRLTSISPLNNISAEQKNVETNSRGESKHKYLSQKADELKPSPSTPEAKDPRSDVSIKETVSLRQRVDALEMGMKFIEMIVSQKPEEMKLMQAQHNNDNSSFEEKIQNRFESKMNAIEKQFNNATETLNSLQNRLEEVSLLIFQK
ncbi:structural maintenance of chromosomes protein 2-like [Emydura macquarii macquarii]|uniref:structural maintenance of chromosomes protein 2-like n=1 Tax=Emydura macquarii macquarii TaxID=1129001 RepID=UPI00352B67B0